MKLPSQDTIEKQFKTHPDSPSGLTNLEIKIPTILTNSSNSLNVSNNHLTTYNLSNQLIDITCSLNNTKSSSPTKPTKLTLSCCPPNTNTLYQLSIPTGVLLTFCFPSNTLIEDINLNIPYKFGFTNLALYIFHEESIYTYSLPAEVISYISHIHYHYQLFSIYTPLKLLFENGCPNHQCSNRCLY
jgi:hypothetical protein